MAEMKVSVGTKQGYAVLTVTPEQLLEKLTRMCVPSNRPKYQITDWWYAAEQSRVLLSQLIQENRSMQEALATFIPGMSEIIDRKKGG